MREGCVQAAFDSPATDTIINVNLCFVFWIPAILHALYLVLK